MHRPTLRLRADPVGLSIDAGRRSQFAFLGLWAHTSVARGRYASASMARLLELQSRTSRRLPARQIGRRNAPQTPWTPRSILSDLPVVRRTDCDPKLFQSPHQKMLDTTDAVNYGKGMETNTNNKWQVFIDPAGSTPFRTYAAAGPYTEHA